MKTFLRRSKHSSSFFFLRSTFVICFSLFGLLIQSEGKKQDKNFHVDNDFAEFDLDEEEYEIQKDSVKRGDIPVEEEEEDDEEEEEEEEEVEVTKRRPLGDSENEQEEAVVEDEDDFAHFNDEEEFEGFSHDDDEDIPSKDKRSPKQPLPKTINIAKVPAHLSNNWENYLLELLMVAGILVYFLNFFTGKTKNQKIATTWFNSHKALLESNFSLVGDDGAKNLDDVESQLIKEAEHSFILWCSGRLCCESMMIEIKLLKRQDLVSVIANLMKPAYDQVQVRVNMNADEMDPFVFCLATKRSAGKLAKEMNDINTFCPEKRSAEKYGVSSNFTVMSEIAEATASMIDSKMTAILNKYPESIESIHFSDQFTGPKLGDDQVATELPEGKKVLIFTFNIPLKDQPVEEVVDNMKPLMLLVFYFMEKIKRYRLSREAKNKAEKNRSKVAEAFWKSIHAARAEKAQEERERKRREIKEKIREMDDPERQRKLEERENRKDKKRNQPKMKQLKVKAM